MKKSPADLSEDEVRRLLARLAERDERALRELHEIFARRIYLFAVSRLRDEDAAQTVMTDTLFEVWKHPDRFRGESRFSTIREGRRSNRPGDNRLHRRGHEGL